jgi:uncharacterized MAPEG superfamily protein
MLPKACPKCHGAYEIDEYTCPTCKVKLKRRSTREGANPRIQRWAFPHPLYFVSEIILAIIGSAIITPLYNSLWYSYYKEQYEESHSSPSILIAIFLLFLIDLGRRYIRDRNKSKYGPRRYWKKLRHQSRAANAQQKRSPESFPATSDKVVVAHTGQSSQLFPVATGRGAEFLTAVK